VHPFLNHILVRGSGFSSPCPCFACVSVGVIPSAGYLPEHTTDVILCFDGCCYDTIRNIIFPVSLILFDYDGALADTLADMLSFAQAACDELGVQHTVSETDLSELEVMSFATLGRACGTPEEQVDEFVRRCTEKFAASKSPPAIFEGLAKVVRQLAASHVLVVVTGNTEGNVRAFLKAHQLQNAK